MTTTGGTCSNLPNRSWCCEIATASCRRTENVDFWKHFHGNSVAIPPKGTFHTGRPFACDSAAYGQACDVLPRRIRGEENASFTTASRRTPEFSDRLSMTLDPNPPRWRVDRRTIRDKTCGQRCPAYCRYLNANGIGGRAGSSKNARQLVSLPELLTFMPPHHGLLPEGGTDRNCRRHRNRIEARCHVEHVTYRPTC